MADLFAEPVGLTPRQEARDRAHLFAGMIYTYLSDHEGLKETERVKVVRAQELLCDVVKEMRA